MPLGSEMASPRGGSIAPLDLQLEKHKQSSSPKLYGPELSYIVWTNV